jgi:hypothetical protein
MKTVTKFNVSVDTTRRIATLLFDNGDQRVAEVVEALYQTLHITPAFIVTYLQSRVSTYRTSLDARQTSSNNRMSS